MKLFCPDYHRIGTMIQLLYLPHLPLRLHRRLLLHPHLPVLALVRHHPILYSFYQILPHPPLPHGRHPPAALLPLLSLRRWIVPINVLLMDEAFYTVIFGRLHDTGLLHRLRLRLILQRFHHHLLRPLLRELYAAAFEHDFFDLGALVQNSAFYSLTVLSFLFLAFPFLSFLSFSPFLSFCAFLHATLAVTHNPYCRYFCSSQF